MGVRRNVEHQGYVHLRKGRHGHVVRQWKHIVMSGIVQVLMCDALSGYTANAVTSDGTNDKLSSSGGVTAAGAVPFLGRQVRLSTIQQFSEQTLLGLNKAGLD